MSLSLNTDESACLYEQKYKFKLDRVDQNFLFSKVKGHEKAVVAKEILPYIFDSYKNKCCAIKYMSTSKKIEVKELLASSNEKFDFGHVAPMIGWWIREMSKQFAEKPLTEFRASAFSWKEFKSSNAKLNEYKLFLKINEWQFVNMSGKSTDCFLKPKNFQI